MNGLFVFFLSGSVSLSMLLQHELCFDCYQGNVIEYEKKKGNWVVSKWSKFDKQ